MRPKRVHPRVERDEIIEVHEDENAHLWAVSYSDFLMALLSFFILFYSVDDAKRDQLIMNISAQLAGDGQLQGKAAGSDSEKEATPTEGRMPASFITALKGLNVKVEEENQFLIVNFPDNIFSAGSYKIRPDQVGLLNRFLEIAKPYHGQFNLYFEGHTDSAPLFHKRNKIITDNYVLSSLRASSALRVAKEAGFEEKYLFTQANSSNVRNSRSLSIRLERRKGTT